MAAENVRIEKHGMQNLIHGEFHKQVMPRSPAQSFGKEKRSIGKPVHEKMREVTGPGRYTPNNNGPETWGGPSFGFGKSERRHTGEYGVNNLYGGTLKPQKVGPGHYDSHATNICDHGPTKTKNPQFSIHGKTDRKHVSSYAPGNPCATTKGNKTGPGSYSPDPSRVSARAPGYGFGPPPREAKAKHNAPGPGRYL
mmetsp:Transcript_127511/g.318386  ORF Transcript_127511/g.318386 Transcript_127511/m.318386 type:complete len:196 (-) Transcript_127511:111-698(-)